MADDMRTKTYPPLPPKGGPRIAIVLPTTGDLQLRSQLPDAFQKDLLIHASAASCQYYARFVVLRKFIVMSTDGDLYTQTVRTSLEYQDLPRQQLLPLPSISPWDIIKVLDLVQCFSGSVSWELVRVRWQSGMMTWLPIELLQRNFGNLLQAFYVNSINSWAFRDRIYGHSVRSFQTEVELWLHHDEFRHFYQYLRKRRVMEATPQLTQEDVKPVLSSSVPLQSQPPVTAQVPPRTQQQIAPTNHNRSYRPQQQQYERQTSARPQPPPPPPPSSSQPPPAAAPTTATEVTQDRRESAVSASAGQVPEAARFVRQQAPLEVDPKQTRTHQASLVKQQASKPAAVQVDNSEQLRVRKRVDRVEPPIADSSDDDDAHRSLSEAAAGSTDPSNTTPPGCNGASKSFKRLRKQQQASTEDGSDSDEDTVLPVLTPSKSGVQPTSSTAPESAPPAVQTPASGDTPSGGTEAPLLTIVNDDDDETDPESSTGPMICGDIRCVCGADSVGTYSGRWLHCWNDACGVWEHADCVGVLGQKNLPTRYTCAKCDPAASRRRLANAQERLVEWLFQCCESKNSVQLLKLLRDNAGQEKKRGWRHPKESGVTLLMKTAHFGLSKCVRYLVEVAKVDVFETDAMSLNALHHAVLGGRSRSVLFLLNKEPKLLSHQDKHGRTPFHCMLESAALSDICLPLLRKDEKLAGVGDLKSNLPIHYACRVITKSTVELCRIMLQTQPSLVHEKSGAGLLPFHLLCEAAAGSELSPTGAALVVKEIIALMLQIDVLGTFLNAGAPNGWTGLHFAAASGNHELLACLCSSEVVDLHASTTDATETALHIAAKSGFHLSVRTLLRAGLRPTAKDAQGWIPMLYADSATCLQEFLSFKLTKQLSRLNRMAAKFQQREIVEKWKRTVVTDSTCFDMVNDWCQCDLERIERMANIFINNPFVLRLDNKLDYFHRFAFPSLRRSTKRESTSDGTTPAPARRKGINFVFSSSRGSYWEQFVRMGKQLEPEDFRAPMQFSTERVPGATAKSTSGGGGDFVLKLVLMRLVSSLSAAEPGFLVCAGGSAAKNLEKPRSDQDQRGRLLDFYLFGELVAHFVLYSVSLSDIFAFSSPFLRSVFGLESRGEKASDARWQLYGRSFAGGFEHVIPSALRILHPDEFRVLMHGRSSMLSARGVDWKSTLDWSSDPESVETRAWLSRLVSELVIEEQQLMLLMLAETLAAANQRFSVTSDDGAAAGKHLVRVIKYSHAEDGEASTFDVDENAPTFDALLPHVDHASCSITLPRYSDYAAFKRAMLRLVRHTDLAFRQR